MAECWRPIGRNPCCLLLWALFLWAALSCEILHGAGASIEGVVKLPENKGAAAMPPRYPGSRITPAAPDLPKAAVYLEGGVPVATTNMPTVELKQENLQFSPNLLVIQVGTSVRFPNRDKEQHSVFSMARAKKLDLGRYKQDAIPPVHVFDKPGVVDLHCDVHKHMRADIVVVQTPYFTTTDSQGGGRFKLENLPVGRFILKAWVNSKMFWSRPVELKEGETLNVQFSDPTPAP